MTTVIAFTSDSRQTKFAMKLAEQERNMRFINHAKEQRDWLVCELSGLVAQSENYQSNERAIRDSIKELDKIILKAIQSPET
ncbi:MAG TPA: hypothetical protein VKR59_10905 [Terriglobales bacterium]|nr:hypothetical protein [Terriglobales bacterium]